MKECIKHGNCEFYFYFNENKIACKEIPYNLITLLDDIDDNLGLKYETVEDNYGNYEIIIQNDVLYRLVVSMYFWGYTEGSRSK